MSSLIEPVSKARIDFDYKRTLGLRVLGTFIRGLTPLFMIVGFSGIKSNSKEKAIGLSGFVISRSLNEPQVFSDIRIIE